MNKIKSKNIKKSLALLVLFSLIPCGINAQEQSDKQESTVLSQYQHEKLTVPYKTTHKVAKGRRVATRKGNKELKKEHYSKAVNDYRNAMKADSNYAKAQFNRALAHSKLHQNDTSITYYDKVCRNSSATAEQRAKAHYNAGNIHLRKALAVDLRDELVTLLLFRFGQQSTSNHIQAGFILAVLGDLIFICSLLGSFDQLHTCPDSIVFYCCLVHFCATMSFLTQ